MVDLDRIEEKISHVCWKQGILKKSGIIEKCG